MYTQQITVNVTEKTCAAKNKNKNKTKRDQKKQTNNKIKEVYPNFLLFCVFEGIPVINNMAVLVVYTAEDILLTKQFKRWDLFFFSSYFGI